MVNIVIIAVLTAAVGLIVRSMVKDKKAGKSSCGCDCGNCGLCKFEVPLERRREYQKTR